MSDRHRFVITCDGTEKKRHKPTVVAIYARDDDGTWLPIHSGFRANGGDLTLPESGYRPEAGQFEWPCPEHHCTYRFRADVTQTAGVLDRLMQAGESGGSLRLIDEALRRTKHAD